ncbi:MAG: ATP-dependent DNA ligase [bacterium]|nr:ATP-dependent DNA ligase [bacterium]
MKFENLSKILEKIENINSRNEITLILSELFLKLQPQEAKLCSYLILGRLVPTYQSLEFNMATKTIIKSISLTFNVSETDVNSKYEEVGDIGEALMTFSINKHSDLNIDQVFNSLSVIAKDSGTGSIDRKIIALSKLLKGLDNLSAKYVVRIIEKKLRLGFSEMTIIDSLSFMFKGDKSLRVVLEDAFNVSADIGNLVFLAKTKPIEEIENIEVTVGIPIRSALPERIPSIADLFEKLGEHLVEPKFDGIRAQIHLDKTKEVEKEEKTQESLFADNAKPKYFVKIFSRSMEDITEMLPEIAEATLLLNCDSVILDCEVIGFNPDTKELLSFQETIKRRRKHDVKNTSEAIPLKAFAFDILYLNGKSLIKAPLNVRRDQIEKLLVDSMVINLIDINRVKTESELQSIWQKYVDRGLEGVISKKEDAIYTPGKRNFNWIKLKKVNESSIEDTLDCVVMGYYLGKGARQKFGIGGFLVGILDNENNNIESLSKVGTGLTEGEWVHLKSEIDKIKVESKPDNFIVDKSLDVDVWASPQLIVEVKADEITLSPMHKASSRYVQEGKGLALRFPRLIKIRDKTLQDSTSSIEVYQIYKDQHGKNEI